MSQRRVQLLLTRHGVSDGYPWIDPNDPQLLRR